MDSPFFFVDKYDAESFNQSISHTWFCKPQPSVRIITCEVKLCVFAIDSVLIEFMRIFQGYEVGRVKFWWIASYFSKFSSHHCFLEYSSYNVN